jgi:Flp pilus assembly protein TadG
MRRLNGVLLGRLRQERGAVAVFVALGMTVLLAFAAVAIDTSAVRRDQQVLRNAADAAALAVALECADKAPFDPATAPATDCPPEAETASTAIAERLVADNAGNVSTVTTSLSGRTVTVTVSADASRPIPIGPGTVSVTSTAEWTPETIGYAASYPLAISYCRYAQLPAQTPSHLASEPNGLWLLPARQQITPAAGNASDSCTGPDGGALVLPSSAMTPTDAGEACGSSSAKDRDVTGQAFEPVSFAARTCVASSQFGDVTSWPHGGYQIVVPVYDQVRGDQYHVWDHLGFHVMGVTDDGALWGFSTGKADPALGTEVPSSVRLTA